MNTTNRDEYKITIQKQVLPMEPTEAEHQYLITNPIGFRWTPKRYIIINNHKVYHSLIETDKNSKDVTVYFVFSEGIVACNYCKRERTIVPFNFCTRR
jgi:hypothetical protein